MPTFPELTKLRQSITQLIDYCKLANFRKKILGQIIENPPTSY